MEYMFVLTVCILRHLKNRQRILESFLIFQIVLQKRGMTDRIAGIHGIPLPERKEKQSCENMAGN